MDRRRVIPIFFIVFINFLGASIVLPTLPLYARRHFGAPPEQISLIVSSYFMALFIAAPFIGRLSDRYGRLPVLIISQIGTVISFVMLGAAQGIPMLFAGRILDGITGGNIIVAQAYVTDITPREHRTEALGVIFAAFGLGYIFGPALGGVLSSFFDDRTPFWVGAVVSLAMVVITWLTLDESLTAEERRRRREESRARLSARAVLTNRPLLLILVTAFGSQMGVAVLQSTFSLYGESVLFSGYTPREASLGIGLLFAVVGFTQLLTQLFILQRWVLRFGERTLVIMGGLMRATGFLLLVLIASPLLGPIPLVLFALGSGIMMPSLQSLTTGTAVEELRGGVLGIYQSSTSLSFIVGSAVAGPLFNITPQTPYLVGTVVYLVVLIPALVLFRTAGAKKLVGGPKVAL